jgi:hypothetical protein
VEEPAQHSHDGADDDEPNPVHGRAVSAGELHETQDWHSVAAGTLRA